MSLSFAVDSNNELIIDNGEFVLVQDGAQVVQNVRQRMLSYMDDFFLDRTHGLPYFQTIFKKPVNLNLTESLLKAQVIETEGVEQLRSFQLQFDKVSRKLLVSVTFKTEFDTVEGVTINV